jgi:hypothetical protein
MDKYGTSQALHLTTQAGQEVGLLPQSPASAHPFARHADYDMQ